MIIIASHLSKHFLARTRDMNEELFSRLYKDVLKLLRENLPPNLFYHSPEHTVDVVRAVERIARAEFCSEREILLLKTAALFHDTGYIRDMREHEKHGCDIAADALRSYKVGEDEIRVVCELIMVTKVPQRPSNKLEEIICDADLDYLGRDDYFSIAGNLYREFLAYEKVRDEKDWMQLQVSFLGAHRYFTKSSANSRQHIADANLNKIRQTVSG